jgi:tetratricopeptide (TPR) repeat protein/glutathione synthase/RimK-type ligase-like ATP-grasp enzyme
MLSHGWTLKKKIIPETRSEALRQLGYQAYRAGKIERAEQLFARALVLCGEGDQQAATLLSDLGVAASALGRDEAARRYHERALHLRRDLLGAAHPDVATSLHNLGVVCRKLGDYAAASACHHEAIDIWRHVYGPAHPALAKGFASLGALAARAGDAPGALRHHQMALRVREAASPLPVADVIASLDDVGNARMQLGDCAGAKHHWRRALALQQAHLAGAGQLRAAIANRLGVAHRRLGETADAAACFAEAVQADPALLQARHNLAALLAREGRHAEAAVHRDYALQRQCIFVQEAAAPCCRVLILAGADIGNVPLEHLLPEASVTRIWWFVAHAGAGESLPAYDVVFNGIGDPDMMAPAASRTDAFLQRCARPVLNRPAQVLMTRRDLLPALLAEIPGVRIPRTLRLHIEGTGLTLRQQIEAAGMAPPFLLRPAGSHGGTGLVRVDDWQNLGLAAADVPGVWYASEYIDCMSADGFTRKYRVAFVDREPYPYHLAISRHWMVHYVSADMPGHAWKLEEEAAFLGGWRALVGAVAAEAIDSIGRRLDLDFCGVDFGIGAGGELVVFEANATMLIHPEPAAGPLSFKNAGVLRIVATMQELLLRAKGG